MFSDHPASDHRGARGRVVKRAAPAASLAGPPPHRCPTLSFVRKILRARILFVGMLVFAGNSVQSRAEASWPEFDFRQPAAAADWKALHDLAPLRATPEGLEMALVGPDPYCAGPPLRLPRTVPLWLELRLWSEAGGTAQVFYFLHQAREEDSVRFEVPAGQWHDVRVPLPPLQDGMRLRFDPPGTRGKCIVARLALSERLIPAPAAWPQPRPPSLTGDSLALSSGALQLVHGRAGPGHLELFVDGMRMAVGHVQSLLGYQQAAGTRWVPLDAPLQVELQEETIAGRPALRLRTVWLDPDGARWELEQAFVAAEPDAIRVSLRIQVDRDRDVWHLPLLWLLPGFQTFGTNKTQAVFAGLEYLENEPSSSTADLHPPASDRQVPDSLKITVPLMAVVAEGRYLGLAWERAGDAVAAVFDSPDRFFSSGAHLMGWLFPGSDGRSRPESSLVPYAPVRLPAGKPVELRGWILGGPGSTVVPAVQQTLHLLGWPAPPAPGLEARDYYRLAARGWLESRIREGDLYRHAVWPGFTPQPAADAAWTMLWLADHVGDNELAHQLQEAAQAAIARVPIHTRNLSQIGHVRHPLPALVFGHVLENARSVSDRARSLLQAFQPDGSLVYEPRAGGPDYSRTHSSREANGYTAERVAELLEAALWTGEPDLIEAALSKLRAMDKFRGTVPRGAQTWEIPLHTPDILAAAHLVRAYVLGYELTGNREWLEQARYWAWTGVPFVYLSPPTPGPIGLYATIPVLGATAWVAPVWLGRPVQWCGLVYADALWQLAAHDPEGPWERLARGIAWSGVQQTWPMEDPERRGLLPDYFLLREQQREGPAINPATVLLPAMRAWGEPLPYTRLVLRRAGLRIHAPGTVRIEAEESDRLVVVVEPWPKHPCWILVNGCSRRPEIRRNGRLVDPDETEPYEATGGRLAIPIQGPTRLELSSWR